MSYVILIERDASLIHVPDVAIVGPFRDLGRAERRGDVIRAESKRWEAEDEGALITVRVMECLPGRASGERAMSVLYGDEVLEPPSRCPACSGTGYDQTDPEDASTCLDCDGRGRVA